MSRSLYLINPASDFPTYFGGEVFAGSGLTPSAPIADLATTTLAAMVPDHFDVTICDEHVAPVDFDTSCQFVGLTAKINQRERMAAIAAEFRRRGKTVLIGGPYATLSPEAVRPHCDVLVRGEIEDLAEGLFADLDHGDWRSEYVGGRPDLDRTPPPQWSLYPNDRAIMAAVQTSRGCPFQCDFCDVPQYLGYQQRHKPIANVLRELDLIYEYGYRAALLADDNFTVARSRTKELLAAIREWNLGRTNGSLQMLTQLSIDAAKDPELLRMCAGAGLSHVFIGVETPNEQSLRDAKKYQNLKIDLIGQIEQFLANGIAVTAGMIVGFDADGPDIFQRQFEFAQASPIPIFSLGALVAPAATPLHRRIEAEGRLLQSGSEVAAMPWDTNIVPLNMTREQLLHGIQWLCRQLYQPAAFRERLVRFSDKLAEPSDLGLTYGLPTNPMAMRTVEKATASLLFKFAELGPAEAELWSEALGMVRRKPTTARYLIRMMLQYLQIRYMYSKGRFWDAPTAPGPMPLVS